MGATAVAPHRWHASTSVDVSHVPNHSALQARQCKRPLSIGIRLNITKPTARYRTVGLTSTT